MMRIGTVGAQLLGVVPVRQQCKIVYIVAVQKCMCVGSLGLLQTENSAPQPGPVR